jgi:hypothetical protein
MAIKHPHEVERAPVADLPAGGDHRMGSRLKEWRDQALHTFSVHHYSSRGPAGREHHQIGIEFQRCQVSGPEPA